MGLLDQISALFGGGADAKSSNLWTVVTEVLNNPQIGGLPGLVQKFEAAGLGGIVNSWIGSGQNEPVSPDQVQDALGREHVDAVANRAGIPTDQLLALLSQHLPGIVDKLTPHGEMPDGGMLQSALSALAQKTNRG